MSEQENLDIGKVIGLIMENPALIAQIANLAKPKAEENTIEAHEVASDEVSLQKEAEEPKAEPTYAPVFNQRNNRAQLLGALKPYVSKERAKAIDSMISIADILDMMKVR
jgi:hypothetical protein